MIFIYYHYLTNRTDTTFWKKVSDSANELPPPLDLIIDSSFNFRTNVNLMDMFDNNAPLVFGKFGYEIVNNGIKKQKKILI